MSMYDLSGADAGGGAAAAAAAVSKVEAIVGAKPQKVCEYEWEPMISLVGAFSP